MSKGRNIGALLALAGMLVAYHGPWTAHFTAGFTMHAYDLAEWASLHPAVRADAPWLRTSLFLRLGWWAIVAGVALAANAWPDARGRWVLRAAALGLALRFVPPQEFFGGASDDPNYRQMAALFALSALTVGGAWALERARGRVQRAAWLSVLALGVGAGWWGLARAGELLYNFQIDVQIGWGAFGYTSAALLGALVVLWPHAETKKGG